MNHDDGLCTPSKHHAPLGVQQKLLWAVQNRLRLELQPPNRTGKRSAIVDKWLFRRLRKHNWWIRREHAHEISARLESCNPGLRLGRHHDAYYRSIFVWLPDVRWGEEAMPCCPSCKCNSDVFSHGFHDSNFGRRVIGLKSNYFMVSKRYVCKSCKKKNENLAKTIKELKAQDTDCSTEIKMKKELRYTFMGWNNTSVALMPNGLGLEFPAFLTHRAGLDSDIIDMLRPMMNKSYRSEGISDLLLELHAKTHHRWAVKYNYDLIRAKNNPISKLETRVSDEMFSSFEDPEKYNDVVPTGRYIAEARQLHHETIRDHLDREVKKVPADTLAWDVSYKEEKNLFRYCGQSVFKGLVSGLDQVGRVRVSFHVVTDSQDQFDAAIEAFLKTLDEYGQPQPQLLYTDNPVNDVAYFTNKIPGLRAQQDKFDALVAANNANKLIATEEDSSVDYPFDSAWVDAIAEGLDEIDGNMAAMMDNIGTQRVIGFDTENKVETTSGRRPTGIRSKVGLLQFAYRDNEKHKHVLLIRLCKQRKIPGGVLALFRDNSITLVGNNIQGDLTNLQKDFPEITNVLKGRGKRNIINIGLAARRRDVVQSAVVGL